jgi:uncharacterized cupredoxin-like copper-binding protein
MKKMTQTVALMAITAAISTISFAHDMKDGAGMKPMVMSESMRIEMCQKMHEGMTADQCREMQKKMMAMHSHSEHQHDAGMNKAGKPGVAANVVRTIHITMSDKNRFTPNSVKVKQGETIRFVVKNEGKKKHEMVIGSVEDIKAHNELMERFPGMEHDEPNMVDLESGQKGEIIWQFTEMGQFQFACLVTGHFEAGMKGVINVVKAPVKAKPKSQTPEDHSNHQH